MAYGIRGTSNCIACVEFCIFYPAPLLSQSGSVSCKALHFWQTFPSETCALLRFRTRSILYFNAEGHISASSFSLLENNVAEYTAFLVCSLIWDSILFLSATLSCRTWLGSWNPSAAPPPCITPADLLRSMRIELGTFQNVVFLATNWATRTSNTKIHKITHDELFLFPGLLSHQRLHF